MDTVSAKKRSQMMAGIRGKNTKPEVLVRKGIFARGYRYRLHQVGLPGKPDIYFPRYKACVFVNGCFWHGHECHLFKWPKTRKEFWEAKIAGNQERDARVRQACLDDGLRVLDIWECALAGRTRMELSVVLDEVEFWLQSEVSYQEIAGAR